ncbi:peptidoglycan DD-metalloendopeptidase family protein [Paenibacillus sp. ACRRX]|uniref:peptidoglycan DD-metalloendopeptidase family protein n=1 Tax=Paenibacillus sp. ACRRX TaxID=2918206 RepID=UPI001EF48004|nr:peptidoglycan DD-metalloendopeptidase family protein [Paenibacillus sp. ACRRX]MCG7408742.1 peptidoglycan DD-metalloendopeptidase family protein [Paenibacillus sp. ACRRX]
MNNRTMKRNIVLLSLICALSAGSMTVFAGASNTTNSGSPAKASTQQNKAVPSKPALFTPDQLPKLLLQEKYERIYKQLSAALKKQIPLNEFKKVGIPFHKGAGSYKLSSKLPVNGLQRYAWVSSKGDKGVEAIFDSKHTIHSILFKPLQKYPQTDAKRTKTKFQLPFHGNWFTFWGGTNALVNYHYEHETQRYAYDIVMEKNGYSYKGDVSKNESYYAFGQPILAAAGGKVVAVVNDIADNVPVGVMNSAQPAGNHVIIDHGNGEFSFYAHLQKGSALVQVGDVVKAGDDLGKCGNSGNSSEAHLHFQVSDGVDLFTSKSIRVQWKDADDYVQGTTIKAP